MANRVGQYSDFSNLYISRAAMLRALGDELRASERARRAGTVELALVEEGGVAMTESYFEVPAPAGAAPGALVEVTL